MKFVIFCLLVVYSWMLININCCGEKIHKSRNKLKKILLDDNKNRILKMKSYNESSADLESVDDEESKMDSLLDSIETQSSINNKCHEDEICNHGVCNMTSLTCDCSHGYVTFFLSAKYNNNTSEHSHSYDYSFCNYSQKKRLIAFVITCLGGFGFEHIYIGNHKYAMIKFVYFFSIFLVFICYECCCKNNPIPELKTIAKSFVGLFIIGWVCMWFLDLLSFYQNKYTDAYGIDLI